MAPQNHPTKVHETSKMNQKNQIRPLDHPRFKHHQASHRRLSSISSSPPSKSDSFLFSAIFSWLLSSPSSSFSSLSSLIVLFFLCCLMAEMENKAHVIEIPVDEDGHHHPKKLSAAAFDDISAIQHHPLMEISQSPGHLLLLKLWQREEERSSRRISFKATQLDGIKSQVFQLCCFFFAFHAFSLVHLFTTSAQLHDHARRKWWIVASLSLVTSLVLIFFVQLRLCRYRRVLGKLQRERSESRALGRCVQELRMKGASFDLSKEPLTTKRLKSSSVEVQWRPLRWCVENAVTICLVCFTGLVVPAGKFVLCG